MPLCFAWEGANPVSHASEMGGDCRLVSPDTGLMQPLVSLYRGGRCRRMALLRTRLIFPTADRAARKQLPRLRRMLVFRR